MHGGHRNGAGQPKKSYSRLLKYMVGRPCTYRDVEFRLGMSKTGAYYVMKKLYDRGLVRKAEKIGYYQIWELA